jgi:protein SCO1/2
LDRASFAAAAGACALAVALASAGPVRAHGGHGTGLSALKQTMIVVPGRQPLRLPALVTTSGAPFDPRQLKGRWSLVFFGFTSCPDVCPTTLRALAEVAADRPAGSRRGARRSSSCRSIRRATRLRG